VVPCSKRWFLEEVAAQSRVVATQGDTADVMVLGGLRAGASSVKRRAMHSDSRPRQCYRRGRRRRRVQEKLHNSAAGVGLLRGALGRDER
jgi:hypothetical protein